MENDKTAGVAVEISDDAIDAALANMVDSVTERVIEQETTRSAKALPELTANEAPKVTGERVPQWERRSFRFIHNVIKAQSNDVAQQAEGKAGLAEYARQSRAMADWQRDEEQEAFEDSIASSSLSRRVQKRLHSTLTGPAGEFALPKPFLSELFVIIESYGLARRLARVVPMGSKDLDLKSISTKPTATWTGEAVLLTESDLALGENVLTTKKLGAITAITKEQDEDAFVALLPTWLDLVGESIAQKEDQAWLIGDGTATYGQFTGLSNLSSVQQQLTGASDLNFSNVDEGDLRSTREKLSMARRGGARWIMHRGLWNEIEQLESGGGDRIVQPRLTENAPRILLGFPVELSEAMTDATSDVANVDFAILGDYRRSLMGVRRDITVESTDAGVTSNSSGVVQYNAFQQDGMLLKISTRIGFQTPTANQDGFAVLTAPAS